MKKIYGVVNTISKARTIAMTVLSTPSEAPRALKFIVPPVYIPVIIAATLLNSGTSGVWKMKYPLMTAVNTAAIPPSSDQSVLGRAFVHSLKSQLNSIKGIASGTVTDMIVDCSLLKLSAASVPGSKCTKPVKAKMIPTA